MTSACTTDGHRKDGHRMSFGEFKDWFRLLGPAEGAAGAEHRASSTPEDEAAASTSTDASGSVRKTV